MKPLTIFAIIFTFFCSLKGEEIKSDEINYAELEKSNRFKSELSSLNDLNHIEIDKIFKTLTSHLRSTSQDGLMNASISL